jgi:hypothetical protein
MGRINGRLLPLPLNWKRFISAWGKGQGKLHGDGFDTVAAGFRRIQPTEHEQLEDQTSKLKKQIAKLDHTMEVVKKL